MFALELLTVTFELDITDNWKVPISERVQKHKNLKQINMGGGCSTLDKQTVSDLERHRVSVDRRKGDLPFQQLLASLPKLFCESGDNSNKCICSCTVSPNCKSIMFGCADVHRAKFYQKEVPMDELKEIVSNIL